MCCHHRLCALVLLAAVVHPSRGRAESQSAATNLEVIGTILTLPKSPPCLDRVMTVTVRYRVEQVLNAVPGAPQPSEVLVRHDCPRRLRGWSRRARGDARGMHTGDRHHLLLRRASGQGGSAQSSRVESVDPFNASEPRYAPLRTNRAPWPPRMIVTVTGNGGTNHRITFDKRQVVVGSSPTADVYLDDASIASSHLKLEVAGDEVLVRGSSACRINGKPLRRATPVNYRSRIVVGPYLLNVVLLTKPWHQPE